MPQLSVVLSTIGNYPVLRRVLDGYDHQDVSPEAFELLVVADRAEPDLDAVRRAIGDHRYPVRLLTGKVAGLAGNRNTGWSAARAPVVLFTDNDTIPVPELVSEHLTWHRRFPEEEVAVVGLIRWARGLKVTPFMKWLEHRFQFDFVSILSEDATWAHLYGANASIKRSFLQRVGGFDEVRLPYLYEDTDWGYRAREHGLRVKLNRRAVVDHWRPMTVDIWRARAPMLAATEWQFCRLHPDIPPWFRNKFANALRSRRAGRWAPAAVRVIPWGLPYLGPLVWERAGLYWLQQIAPAFLAAWEEADTTGRPAVEPDVAVLLAEREGRFV